MKRSALRAIVRKEFIQIYRDKATVYMAFVFPLMMLVLCGFGIRYDVKSLPVTVLDRDGTQKARQYIEKFEHSPYFSVRRYAATYRELQEDIDRGRTLIGLVLPPDFSEKVSSNRHAIVQVIVDGTDSNTATIAMSYVSAITQEYSSSIVAKRIDTLLRRTQVPVNAVEAEARIWFNPDLESVQFIVPGIIAILMMMVGTVLTATTIVREKEQGTIEQIVSSPIGRYEVMISKVIPYAALSYLDFLLIVLASYVLFHVHIKGSLTLLLATGLFYLIGVLGIGILISTVTQTQTSATLIAFIVSFLPSVLLSGFIFPIQQMPRILQALTIFVPARYFIEILRDIYLKGLGLESFWKETLYIMLFGFITITLSARAFQKRLNR
jgi:ABC-2 type transport system permease protein